MTTGGWLDLAHTMLIAWGVVKLGCHYDYDYDLVCLCGMPCCAMMLSVWKMGAWVGVLPMRSLHWGYIGVGAFHWGYIGVGALHWGYIGVGVLHWGYIGVGAFHWGYIGVGLGFCQSEVGLYFVNKGRCLGIIYNEFI